MAITKFDRAWACNVVIETKSDPIVYQQDGLLRVKDIAYYLELILIFDKPDGGAAIWQPALLQKGISANPIILDQQDVTEFPTPQSGKTFYNYVYHSSECGRRDLHALGGI